MMQQEKIPAANNLYRPYPLAAWRQHCNAPNPVQIDDLVHASSFNNILQMLQQTRPERRDRRGATTWGNR